jgi:hypothetical protein
MVKYVIRRIIFDRNDKMSGALVHCMDKTEVVGSELVASLVKEVSGLRRASTGQEPNKYWESGTLTMCE